MKKAAEQEGLLDGQKVLSLQAEVGGQWYWLKQEEKQEENHLPWPRNSPWSRSAGPSTKGGRFFVSFDGNQVKKCRDSHGFCPIHPVKL